MAASSFTIGDLEYSFYDACIDVNGNFTGLPVVSTSASPITVEPYDTDGQSGSGSANAPALGAQIAVVAVAAGTWDVYVQTLVGGTPAAADVLNMELRSGATPLFNVISPTGTTVNPGPAPVRRVKKASAGNFSINATAAATAGTVYYASISCIRVR